MTQWILLFVIVALVVLGTVISERAVQVAFYLLALAVALYLVARLIGWH